MMDQELDMEDQEILETMQWIEEQKLKREKKLWAEVQGSRNLGDMLKELTKYELDSIRQELEFKGLSNLKKDLLINELARLIPERITEILGTFDQERFELVKRLAQRGGVMPVSKAIQENVEYYREKGLIFTGRLDRKKVLIMPTEIVKSVQSLAIQHIEKIAKRNSEWVTLTHGLLYYYGVLELESIKAMLERLTGKPINLFDLRLVINDAINYYHQITYCADGYCDGLVEDTQELVAEQRARANIDYFPFSKNRLLEAGRPDFVEWTPALRILESLIKTEYVVEQEEVEEIILELVDAIRMENTPEDVMDFMQSVLEIPSLAFLQKLMEVLGNVANTTRLWILKGHTPNEVFSEEQTLSDVPLGEKERYGQVFDFTTGAKVGRNDICPCGSNKKYKKCCGKGV